MARAELAPVIPLRAPVSGEDELSRLRRAVDLPRLIEVGYDPRAHIISPHAEHPVFGYALCPVVHCTAAVERHALCEACWRRFEGFQGTLEEFAQLPRARIHGPAQQPLCLVCRTAGHERTHQRVGFMKALAQAALGCNSIRCDKAGKNAGVDLLFQTPKTMRAWCVR